METKNSFILDFTIVMLTGSSEILKVTVMAVVVITGSNGLIGSESVRFYCEKGYTIAGIDNDMRRSFFGDDASTLWMRDRLMKKYTNYFHHHVDIRDSEGISAIFKKYGKDISLIIHTAAQPSHDWAAGDPFTDFSVNATGTLSLLQCMRDTCPEAVFIFTSTNKVYGDLPNSLPLHEEETRYEVDENHHWSKGIDETMSLDQCRHSLFGVSKAAADLMVQEYGRYFGFKTGIFRGGCLTGPSHSGTMLHGFLSYLMRCCITGKKYYIYGYKGKQVRDNIHSADFVAALHHFYENPGVARVYNMGGGRNANISVIEAISRCEEIACRHMNTEYIDKNREGDHKWWITDVSRFRSHYPKWEYNYDIYRTLKEIHVEQKHLLR